MIDEITKLKRKHKTWTLLDCAMFLLNRTDRRTVDVGNHVCIGFNDGNDVYGMFFV